MLDSDGSTRLTSGMLQEFFALNHHIRFDLSEDVISYYYFRDGDKDKLAKNNVGGFYTISASTIWTKFRMSIVN
jgi:hypothetical protein